VESKSSTPPPLRPSSGSKIAADAVTTWGVKWTPCFGPKTSDPSLHPVRSS
jgi:hypothetical protein